jgi:hypothetical protein
MYLCTSDKGGTLDSTAITWTKVTPQAAGTVTSIAAGTGLSGGTITSSGTIAATGRLADVAGLAVTDSGVIVGDGSNFVLETGATLRTSLGLGTGDSPQFTAVNVGAASDTTLARSGAGDITIEGNAIYRAGGTDVPVADGGTGASSLTDGGILLGSGTSAITAMSALSKGSIVAGDGATDPVALAVGTNDYVLTADSGEASGLKWAAAGGGFTLGTEQASTSGNTVTFSSIPAGTKMIIISLEGVSLNGTAGNFTVQIGDAGGLETSGYLGGAWASSGLTSTAGEAFRLYSQNASDLMSGHVILTLKDASNFTWISSSTIWGVNTSAISGGLKSLSAELTQVAVKASADSFDAGSINIMYM